MKNASASALALAGLLLAGAAGPAFAAERRPAPAPHPQPHAKVQKKVVVIDKDGKEHVIESDGTPVRRGYLGVGLTELSPELRAHFGVPEDAGVMVSSVEKGSPAEKAGIKVGDIITSLDGKEIASSWDLRAQVRELKEGEQVPLMVWRNGKAQNLSASIVLRERPELDVAPFFFRGEGGEGGPIQFERHLLEGPEGRQHFRMMAPGPDGPRAHRAPGAPGLRSPREMELEKRLKELEKRLAELEKQLEKK